MSEMIPIKDDGRGEEELSANLGLDPAFSAGSTGTPLFSAVAVAAAAAGSQQLEEESANVPTTTTTTEQVLITLESPPPPPTAASSSSVSMTNHHPPTTMKDPPNSSVSIATTTDRTTDTTTTLIVTTAESEATTTNYDDPSSQKRNVSHLSSRPEEEGTILGEESTTTTPGDSNKKLKMSPPDVKVEEDQEEEDSSKRKNIAVAEKPTLTTAATTTTTTTQNGGNYHPVPTIMNHKEPGDGDDDMPQQHLVEKETMKMNGSSHNNNNNNSNNNIGDNGLEEKDAIMDLHPDDVPNKPLLQLENDDEMIVDDAPSMTALKQEKIIVNNGQPVVVNNNDNNKNKKNPSSDDSPSSLLTSPLTPGGTTTTTTTTTTTQTGTTERHAGLNHHHDQTSSPPSVLETVGMSTSQEEETTTTTSPSSQPPSPPLATKKDEIVSQYIELLPMPTKPTKLSQLSQGELTQLENCLEIGKSETWRDDWIGNLAFADAEIFNPDGKPFRGPRKTLLRWAEKGKTSIKILYNLLRYVYSLKETPPTAKKILSATNAKSWTSLHHAVRRVSYDPMVLREDGWTTAKSEEAVGATGGPFRIGEMVYWQGYEGVVIAYLHDHDLGDLWKAMWLEEFDTFDLEAEELEDARRKYDRKKQKESSEPPPTTKVSSSSTSSSKQAASDEENKGPTTSSSKRSSSSRYSATADFFVKGIEHGIVLATSYSRGSRSGVFWPARVMHASEMHSYGTINKRGSQKQKIDVMFLAPYWNAAPIAPSSRRGVVESFSDTISRHGTSVFSSGPLFEMESIDASADAVQEYPYDVDRGLDMDQLRMSFKFSGLPKAAFSRFVDSHRLALGLKTFSQTRLNSTVTDLDRTTAGLFEVHPLAVHTALFPSELLHLPFGYMLSQLPIPGRDDQTTSYNDDPQSSVEPSLQLGAMLDAMKPPVCWGKGESKASVSNNDLPQTRAFASPPIPQRLVSGKADTPIKIETFITDLSSLQDVLGTVGKSSVTPLLATYLDQFLSKLPKDFAESEGLSIESRRVKAKSLVSSWMLVKTHGEELIRSAAGETSVSLLGEWRRACERLYRYMTVALSIGGYGNGISSVLTDSLCNQHLTSSGCMERAVRLPAAIRAAKEAGAGNESNIHLITAIDEKYLEIAEEKIVSKAHSKSYLRRMKSRCMAVPDNEIVALTQDSDGNGGEDTKGSRGTWMAALAGVAAAIKAVDMIMNGECVNVFCATRPPGHHAGRELHPMKAVSNGFCILNAVACAALYATTPLSEDGPGLRRVCIIDIDVHHGNGTQDVLCGTYDPRFLYISMHAGGADVNGVQPGDEDEQLTHHLGRTAKRGIFPGRCGDTSPHPGVLNIPLGTRVTSNAIGNALITKVAKAVEIFSPELIIISAGFDAHKNDPLGLGGLNAVDFASLTEAICQLAHKQCSGRVLSVLEGGYGVPCCRKQDNWFLPENVRPPSADGPQDVAGGSNAGNTLDLPTASTAEAPKSNLPDSSQKPLPLFDLGEEIPPDMKDELPYPLQKRLDKCHAEGFMQCVREHVRTLAKCNERK